MDLFTPQASSRASHSSADSFHSPGSGLRPQNRTQALSEFSNAISRQIVDTSGDEASFNELRLIGFTVGPQKFGINILATQEVIKYSPITKVPNSPDFIEGVLNLRGSIIPIIDLRKRLGIGDASRDGDKDKLRMLIASLGDRRTGFIVDSVSSVIEVQSEDLEEPPDIILAGPNNHLIENVCHIKTKDADGAEVDELIILLNFDRVLSTTELTELTKIQPDSKE